MTLLILFVVAALGGASAGFTDLGEGECRDSTGQYALWFAKNSGVLQEIKDICSNLVWCRATQDSPNHVAIVTTHEVFDPLDPIDQIAFPQWGEIVSFSGKTWNAYEGGGNGWPDNIIATTGVLPITLNPRIGYRCFVKNIDECVDGTDTCDPNAICTDNTGGYSCECKTGYSGDGFTCTQVDECTDGTDTCDANAICTDNTGGYSCECKTGYSGDGFTCAQVDECADGTDTCDANAICTDNAGGYSCECKTGYSGDGSTCTQDPYTKYPGYAANWDSSPGAPFQPLRLYHNDRSDLTASLAACEAECQGDTGCYAVEWRANVECRLFDYKPIVYVYTSSWTVSVQIRTFVQLYSDCGEYCGNGAVDSDTGRTFTGNDYNYVPTYFKPCSTGSANEGWTCEPGQDFGGNFGKTGGFNDKAADFGDNTGSVFDKAGGGFNGNTGFNKTGGFNTTFVRWGAGIGLGVVAVFLGVKLVRRKRAFAAYSLV